MDKQPKKTANKSLNHQTKQQGRKLDLLLAEVERQAERLKNLQDSKLGTNRHQAGKLAKM